MADPHPEFDSLFRAVRRSPPGPVLFLGAVDSGKTTLLRSLASALAAQGPVRLVDADVGQSWLGPPTTLGRIRLARPRKRWSGMNPARMVFFGATSPAPSTRLCADALVRLARADVGPDERVLVDTPGLVTGPAAEVLWRHVAERLGARVVVAIGRPRELAPILGPFRDAAARVVTCAPDPRVRMRGRAERTAYREAAYRRYFRGAALRYAHRSRLTIRPAFRWRAAALESGRLVGLRDAAGRDLALGVVRSLGEERVGVLTPLESLRDVAALVGGVLRLDPATGREAYD